MDAPPSTSHRPLSVREDKPQTKTALAVRTLRHALLNGTIHQGQQLTVGELAAQLGMSSTPIREAIRILQGEGLIQFTPHHALTVRALTPKVAQDIFVIRLEVEPLATRLAMARMTSVDFDRLAEINDAMRDALDHGQIEDRYALNRSWHFTLYAHTHNRAMIETIESLWQRFLWPTTWFMPSHAGHSHEHHTAITQALRAGDGDTAARLMREHILLREQNTLAFFASQTAAGGEPA